MDLLESGGEREPVRIASLLGVRLPGWVVAAVAVAVGLALVASMAGAVVVRRALEREAARPDVAVQVESAFSTVGGVARGALELRLSNRGQRPVQVSLDLEVEGLRVLDVRPALPIALSTGARTDVRISYLVPSCAAIVLPGRLLLTLRTAEQEVQRVLPVVDPGDRARPDSEVVPLGACPPSARSAAPGEPTDVGARSAGGFVRRTGDGAEGIARVEVRNGGPALRLLSVDARVPGAVFTPRVVAGGLPLPPDGLVIVPLRFRVPDCSRPPAGWCCGCSGSAACRSSGCG